MFEGRTGETSGEVSADFSPPAPASAKLPVLIVLHQHHSKPGHVGHWFRQNGHALDIRRHFAGDPLPETLSGHCGAIIFGGPQSANDDIGFIKREIDWIDVPLRENKPFFGICLGGQMLAKKLGARVDHSPDGSVEIGYHPIQPTEAGRDRDFPSLVFQWHREGFDIPAGGTLLATSEGPYPNQAFEFGTAVGIQFHPEITHQQINHWSGGNPMRLLMRGARSRQEQFEHHLMHAGHVHQWLGLFLSRWVEGQCTRPT